MTAGEAVGLLWALFRVCNGINFKSREVVANGCTFRCIYSITHAIFACSAAAEEMALEMMLTNDILNKWIARTKE